jgi:hypothetical protein
MRKAILGASVLVAVFAFAAEMPEVSGIYPHLAMFNNEGECGTGAVVPWADRLWAVTYAPHAPGTSSDKLYEITPELQQVIRPESVGGTHANRMIHRESNQLFIGPYVINAERQVRVIARTNLYGRLTANMRHLTDPTNRIYYATMEEGFYDVDVHTLAVKELYQDGNRKANIANDLLPGYHGKGAYSGQGRVVYANNGEMSSAAQKNPAITSGVLAQWNGADWQVVLRNQFTEVTGPGGIYGNPYPADDPLWSIGWDFRSLILMCLDHGVWHKWRLPKGSHSYDGAHGWNTEWPRIRDIGEEDSLLMTMHGTFWRFPLSFDATHSSGIAPRSNYLKVIGDFCGWNGRVVFGCDDDANSSFLNQRKLKGTCEGPRQSNSNLWFVQPDALDSFGPVIGRGAVWMGDAVTNGVPSDPYLFDGYANRALYVAAAGPCAFRIEADVKGNGQWTQWKTVEAKGGDAVAEFPFAATETAAWIRLVPTGDAANVYAFFQYANQDNRAAAPAAISEGLGGSLGGFVYSRGAGLGTLGLAAMTVDRTGEKDIGFYELTAGLTLTNVPGSSSSWTKAHYKMDGTGITCEPASILLTDDSGKRWRLPYGQAKGLLVKLDSEGGFATNRICREVSTERDLLNVGGTFFEAPAENAGGFAKMRPIATHNLAIHDFCGWRGMLVMTGVGATAAASKHIVRSTDGKAAVWVGAIDDLWAFGKARGNGGPWKATAIQAGGVSDAYLMTGYDKKKLTLTQDGAPKAVFTLELDITGTGVWKTFRTYEVGQNKTVVDNLDATRAYWLRFRSDVPCTATAQLEYR